MQLFERVLQIERENVKEKKTKLLYLRERENKDTQIERYSEREKERKKDTERKTEREGKRERVRVRESEIERELISWSSELRSY